MADRGELPRVLAAVHPRFLTPHVAIVSFSVVAGILAIAGTFEGNAILSAIVRLIVYAMVCVSLWVFRRTKAPAYFQVPFAIPVSILALGFCAYMLSTRSFAQAGLIVATLPLPFLFDLALPTITASILLFPVAIYMYIQLMLAIGYTTAVNVADEVRNDTFTLLRATPMSLGMRTEPPPPTKMPREPSGSA